MRNSFEEGFSRPGRRSQQQLASELRTRFEYILCGAGASGSKVAASSATCWWKRNITILALALSASFSNANAQKTLTADQTQIVETVQTVFAAAQADDITMLDTVIARDFYIYDGGTRLNGAGVINFIKTQHAAGKRFEWNVTEPDVHVSGTTAWIAYVNKGSIADASGATDQKWLESAFLEKQMGVWKIVFMHSTRVPAAVEGNHGK